MKLSNETKRILQIAEASNGGPSEEQVIGVYPNIYQIPGSEDVEKVLHLSLLNLDPKFNNFTNSEI